MQNTEPTLAEILAAQIERDLRLAGYRIKPERRMRLWPLALMVSAVAASPFYPPIVASALSR